MGHFCVCHHVDLQEELRQHLLRTKYIACLWRNAHRHVPTEISPLQYGWRNIDGKLEPKWFLGKQLPVAYEDILIIPDILGDTPELEPRDDKDVQEIEVVSNFEDESASEDEN